jgi:hypothetical protein
MRRSLTAEFKLQDLGQGTVKISATEPAPVDIWVRGADAGLSHFSSCTSVDIDWLGEGVSVYLKQGAQKAQFRAGSVVIHEPKSHLYEALPLGSVDAKTRRFWRRIFTAVRLPGGLRLLGFMAARSRNLR